MTTLAELLQRPVMPEEYDRTAPLGPLQPHAEAFGAGVIDPMGIPSWAANKLMNSPNADWYQRWAQEKRDQSPVAAGMGSSVLPGILGLGALRGVGELTTREALQGFPFATQLGLVLGGARNSVSPPPQRQRPQGAYPPGGAY
jgi:hypothetical protein